MISSDAMLSKQIFSIGHTENFWENKKKQKKNLPQFYYYIVANDDADLGTWWFMIVWGVKIHRYFFLIYLWYEIDEFLN